MKYAKEAEEDIICYKVVENAAVYKSIWYDFKYKIGNRYHERSFCTYSTKGATSHEVSYGFHSYATLKKPSIRFSEGWYPDNYVVLKCIIPKGTLYFISNDLHTEYCSQDIMVVSELRYDMENNEVIWNEWPKSKEPEF